MEFNVSSKSIHFILEGFPNRVNKDDKDYVSHVSIYIYIILYIIMIVIKHTGLIIRMYGTLGSMHPSTPCDGGKCDPSTSSVMLVLLLINHGGALGTNRTYIIYDYGTVHV